jgi:hypothetical protein
MNKIALLVVASAALFATSVAAQQDIGKSAKVTLVFDQQLPNVPGKSLRVVLVEYGPLCPRIKGDEPDGKDAVHHVRDEAPAPNFSRRPNER